MIKLSALFWLVLVSATGFATFAVKYEVQAVADELAQTTKRSDDAERDIRVLGAEWAYLNRPDALAQMNQRYLSLAPMATKQLIAGVSDVPMRPAPPPVAEPAVAVAENSPPTATPPTATPASISVVAQYPAETQPSMRQSSSPSQPPASAAPVVTVALETRAPQTEPAKPVLIKAAMHPTSAHRAKSLDELIAQISESR